MFALQDLISKYLQRLFILAKPVSDYVIEVAGFIRIIFFTAWNKRSLKAAARIEIGKLKSNNENYKRYRYNFIYELTNFLDRYKLLFVCVLFGLCILALLVTNCSQAVLLTDDCKNISTRFSWLLPGSFSEDGVAKSTTGDNFHAFLGTVQATVFSLIIPISVAMYEFVFKGKQLKEEIVTFIFRESRVRLITLSSLALLIWVTLVEAAKIIYDDFKLSAGSNVIEGLWLVLNLMLVGYFTYTALNLINRSRFNFALQRFFVNESYPNELQGYLERNILANKNTRTENDDDE